MTKTHSLRSSAAGAIAAALLFSLLPSSELFAQQSADGVWTRIELHPAQLHSFSLSPQLDKGTSAFQLNRNALREALARAPKEFTTEGGNGLSSVTVPLPNGTFATFTVEETSIVEAPLQSLESRVRTYKGFGVDDPTATLRIEVSRIGFHGMVRSASGTIFIDPIRDDGMALAPESYLSYFPGPKRGKQRCIVAEDQVRQDRSNKETTHSPTPRAGPMSLAFHDNILRTYRLALAANSLYAAAIYDPSVPGEKLDQVIAAIHTTIDRVDGIFEAELGIRLVLVKDEARIIYTDTDNDPYAVINAHAEQSLAFNQTHLDAVIGSANYDIGHLFTTGTAGLASVASVCDACRKGQATTGISDPYGDAFAVDYVAHEIGHQFGANHTFNGTLGFCGKGTRNALTAYEPGSASTIMGYTGGNPPLCGAESLQDHSDSYFHAISLQEITEYVSNDSIGYGGSCATKIPTRMGSWPNVTMDFDYVIPKGTPFTLTSTSAVDTDGQVRLTYAWEQFDLGDPAPPEDDSGLIATGRPLFRSYPPSENRSRTFPRAASLLSAPQPVASWERLPLVARTMTFRVTVRDNHGQFTYSEVSVKVTDNSGPFLVLEPTDGTTWSRGSTHTIRWDVANTDASPVNCPQLRALLVIDNDDANPFVIADAILNKGSYTFMVSQSAPVTSHARLKLEAVGNIFFAVSSYDLQITGESKP